MLISMNGRRFHYLFDEHAKLLVAITTTTFFSKYVPGFLFKFQNKVHLFNKAATAVVL